MGLSFLEQEHAPPPTIIDPFDPAPVAELFDNFNAAINRMQAEAAAVTVTDDASKDRAITMIGESKQVIKRIEAERVKVKAPYLQMCKAIDGFASPLVAAVSGIANRLESAVRPYLIEQDRKRREAEAQARREAEDARRKAEAEAAERAAKSAREAQEHGEPAPAPEPVFVPPPAPIAAETRTVTDTATATVDRVWAWDVTDLAALLAHEGLIEARFNELLKAATPWLNAQVKAGVRRIPGVAIYQTEKVSTRMRR